MAKNYFNRYVWLIDTIQRYKYIQFKDLQNEWSRSALNENGETLAQRTFFNHKDAILDTFGIEIKFDKSRGYYISEDELNFKGFKNWLLSSLSVNNLLLECSDMRSRILFDEVPGGVNHLKPIVDAMRVNQELEITYQKFLDDEPFTFNLQPYCIKSLKQRWYVLGKNSYDKKKKSSALDRILALSMTDKKFKMPANFNASEYFYPLYGLVGGEEKPRTVRLKVLDEQRGYIRTLPLHHTQKEIEIKDDYSVFSYFMVPSYELIYDLLSMEDMVEVLEPADFRAKVKAQVDAMYKLYKKG